MDNLNNRYEIIKEIGRGGMGIVYLAKSLSVGNLWAVKKVPKKDRESFDFLAEPNILKKLNHPALPRIVDIFEDEEAIYIVEDYIEGEALDKQLQKRKSFDEATVIEWCKQLCKVLMYLHNQKPNPIIYRDMKPSNIIANSDNVVKLIDFGIAREYKTDSGSDTSYVGTRGYAAPEQYGISQTDARTDIYSLGVTMYHLLTGKSPNEPPYEFLPLRELNQEFSEGIEYIVNKCIQNNPELRYQTVEDLIYDLDNIYLFNGVYRDWKKKQKTKTILKAVMLAGFAVMTIGGIYVMELEKQEKYYDYVAEGTAFMENNDHKAAIETFEEAIDLQPRFTEAYLGKARVLLDQHLGEECLVYLEEAKAACEGIETEAQYHYVNGMAQYELKDYEEAITALEQSVTLDPDQIEYQRDLAICHIKNKDTATAEEILGQLQRQNASDDILFYVDAQLYAEKGQMEKAEEFFEKALEETTNETVKWKTYVEYALMYKERRDTYEGALDKQIAVMEEAIRELKREDDLYITEMMAEAYYTDRNYKLAAEKFQRLLELGYDRAYIYRNIAIINQINGDYSAAESILLEAAERFPGDYENYMQLGLIAARAEGEKGNQQRDYSRVLEYFNKAADCLPNGKSSVELAQLKAVVDELTAKGWL